MLKGTNRQVIEITQTDCEYFERVMFFVKPECVNVSEGKLRERASAIAGSDSRPPAMKIHRSRLKAAAFIAAGAAAGATATAALAAFIL
ncbi:MAG: hypothetical protein IKK85_06435 [Clostridia bacterium]|nr:hypothetical protein [Clostridia bacterium]